MTLIFKIMLLGWSEIIFSLAKLNRILLYLLKLDINKKRVTQVENILMSRPFLRLILLIFVYY